MRRAVVWWLVLAGLWLGLSDNHHADEVVAGALAATVGTVVALVAWDRMVPPMRIPRSAWADLPRIAWRMVVESGLLLLALWQAVVLRRPVHGRWVSEPCDDADTPEGRGRRAWAVLSGSAAPNRVVGDAEGGRVLVHELMRR
jgi:hypothetical protein